MNFQIAKRAFYNALSIASRATSSNSPIPALSGIKIEAETSKLILTSSNEDISIQLTLDANDENNHLTIFSEGSIVIDSRYLIEIVRKIEDDDVKVEIMDGTLTRISGEYAEFNINGMRGNDYPNIDFRKPNQVIEIDADTLLKTIMQTSFATSDKETRPVLTGVNFKSMGSYVECVATDSYRLARKFINLEVPSNFNITIPAKSLNEVSKIIEHDTMIQLAVDANKAQFYLDNVLIQTRLIDGGYPETNRLIPTEFKYELTIDARKILNAMDRAAFIKNDGVHVIRLVAKEDDLEISSFSQEVGSSTENITASDHVGEGISISFSGKYVIDAIRSLAANKVTIRFSGEMKPFLITNPDDDSILQLVLPVRTYN
ncbi:MAG: DNA polymerase III subunit beta [Erysipelotrichaceae bacterium]|nr:DNA polymerase III subunit beta [Erysipelotrichaceae bacterium]